MVPIIPAIGDAVHYVAFGTPGGEYPAGVCRAAIITEVRTDIEVGLCILNPTGLFFLRSAMLDPGSAPGTWHWSEVEGEPA